MEDSKGNLWVSSLNGWNRFDGESSSSYTQKQGIRGDFIQSNLYEDMNSTLWSTTYQYLIKYDRNLDNFESFKLAEGKREYLSNYHLFHFDELNQYLWMLVDSTIGYFHIEDYNSFIPVIKKTKGRRFFFSADSKVLFAFPFIGESGMEVYDLSADTSNVNYNSLLTIDSATFVHNAIEFEEKIIFGTNRGILEYSKCNRTCQLLNNEVEGSFIEDLVKVDSFILVSTKYKGLFVYDENVKLIGVYKGQRVREVNVTENLICLSFPEVGVECFKKTNALEVLLAEKCLASKGLRLYAVSDQLSIGIEDSGYGVYKYDFLNCESIFLFEFTERINEVVVSDGRVFASTNNGIELIYPKRKKIYENYNVNISDISIADNYLFACTSFGVIKRSLNDEISETEDWETGLFDYPNILEITGRDSFYFLKDGYGGYLLNGNNVERLNLSDYVLKSFVTTENLILSTSEYLYKISLSDLSKRDSLSWSVQHANGVKFIEFINRELLFTHDGFYSLDKLMFYPYSEIGYSELNFSSIHKKGIKSFSYIDGELLVNVETNNLGSNNYDSFLKINHINYKVNNIPYSISDLSSLVLRQPIESISISCNCFGLYSSGLLEYKLSDNSWVKSKCGEKINIDQIETGNVIIDIRSLNDSHLPSDTVQVAFTILPPYHQTWWFRTSCALGLLGLGFGANFANTKRKLRKAQILLEKQQALSAQREKIADDLHDELGTELSKILYLGDEATETTDPNKKEKLVKDITNLAAGSIANMRDMLWVLEHKNDTLDSLLAKIRISAQKTLQEYPIQLHIAFPNPIPDLPISGDKRQQVLLVIKEAIHNVIKHAKAKNLTLKYEQDEAGNFVFSVKDDGVGHASLDEYATKGRGLNSMRKRMDSIEGKLALSSTIGQGTSVRLVLTNLPNS